MKAQAHKDLGTFFYDYSERVDQVSLCYPLDFSSPVKRSYNPKGRRTRLGFSLWPHYWDLTLGEAGEDQHR